MLTSHLFLASRSTLATISKDSHFATRLSPTTSLDLIHLASSSSASRTKPNKMSSSEKFPHGKAAKSDISPAVSSIARFLAFTLALITLPLTTYYICVNKIPAFGGSSTLGGALAAVVANIILIAYLGVVMFEDSEEINAGKTHREVKKTQRKDNGHGSREGYGDEEEIGHGQAAASGDRGSFVRDQDRD
ncbi:vacuolar ATPase assembly integral membrane protein VMA21 [Zalerion maritima]|uniref:Vacuolar ATPase assembly integral membrane protein VMA21 n=1 Tax=Zalerion maritima TaxID=339359 RepID=A0AAD5S340_9PEZI|nr:vacuolar ATPase assembly integral membrane protein VMA21 [Zalerion maritima]